MTRSPAFGVRAQAVERAHVVAPRGELDLFTVEEVEAALRERSEPCERVVLDLRAVTFLDTSGMRLDPKPFGSRPPMGIPLVRATAVTPGIAASCSSIALCICAT